ncbi:MAG TPA: hypothetical protein VLD39_04835, partial [Gammaproteobacteria bacterium]|nr:hypothetical protein [Gammaproteobacteria bacterium]
MKALIFVSLIAVLVPGVLTHAHEFSPGFLGFTELAPDEYRVQWKVSLTGGLADALTPQLPEACAFSGPL